MKNFDYDGFRKDMEQAMQSVESKYGVKTTIGNITYSDGGFTSKFQATKVGEGEEGMTQQEIQWKQDFLRHAHLYGFKESDFGKVVGNYKLIGLRPRAGKYPIVVEKVDDKSRAGLTMRDAQKRFGAEETVTLQRPSV